MFQDLQILQMAHDSARHAGKRQALTAMNIANADTPGYRARDIADFSPNIQRAQVSLKATRPGHQGGRTLSAGMTFNEIELNGETNPNGNSVSLEEEMVRSVEAERQHRRAVTVYQQSMTVLRLSIGRR